ncbi:uncharacterized protein [Parasteatoda tepidariorum]|uniref:uncharacterized protein n=1 Tax=Parasteatoda tepidariorum TaxID=114398 RepID=UPI001C722B86|nr:uncharacterized protein LOC122271517 [Parasteatoda tepidariorum]
MTTNIELLKKKRTTLRTSVTKLISKIESEIQKNEITDEETEIDLIIEQLNDKFESLKTVDSELENLFKPEDLDKELETAEEYREKIVTWRFKANKYLRNLNQKKNIREPLNFPQHIAPTTNREVEVETKPEMLNIKLPKIVIPKFSGNISDWLTFWNSFETSIHKNKSLDDVSKFNYLKAHLCGTALETIGGFAISSENYVKAIDLLEQRFGRKETLINNHMSQLLEITPLKRSGDVKNFRQLFDKIQIHIRSLESLGISSDTFSTLLSPVILKSIPNDLLFEFNKEFGEKYSLTVLINFLNKQLIAKEKTDLMRVKEKQNSPPNINEVSWRHHKRGEREVKYDGERNPTANELFVYDSTSKARSCPFCGELNCSGLNCEYGKVYL